MYVCMYVCMYVYSFSTFGHIYHSHVYHDIRSTHPTNLRKTQVTLWNNALFWFLGQYAFRVSRLGGAESQALGPEIAFLDSHRPLPVQPPAKVHSALGSLHEPLRSVVALLMRGVMTTDWGTRRACALSLTRLAVAAQEPARIVLYELLVGLAAFCASGMWVDRSVNGLVMT
jgi:hypothetical protein